jgi:hypothetical protein
MASAPQLMVGARWMAYDLRSPNMLFCSTSSWVQQVNQTVDVKMTNATMQTVWVSYTVLPRVGFSLPFRNCPPPTNLIMGTF